MILGSTPISPSGPVMLLRCGVTNRSRNRKGAENSGFWFMGATCFARLSPGTETKFVAQGRGRSKYQAPGLVRVIATSEKNQISLRSQSGLCGAFAVEEDGNQAKRRS
jgi:hypothetical protein